jgi:hypothetical protein
MAVYFTPSLRCFWAIWLSGFYVQNVLSDVEVMYMATARWLLLLDSKSLVC